MFIILVARPSFLENASFECNIIRTTFRKECCPTFDNLDPRLYTKRPL